MKAFGFQFDLKSD